ncbi:hypothetical protein FBEOM_12527 [Fusarium beomiforme]|uniref:Uncharacterized protein n=1 Tax=Fusarium beomiforme TaxID=44412 RepID=A0A9P5DPK0_9HYPO|nr:hypothetical protein FBEOM_12527 [Fusarium beomiforme]
MDAPNPRHGSHPSDSIPDAAYPNDSPYRPGDQSPHSNVAPGASPSSQSQSYSPPPPTTHFGASISPTASPWSPDIPSSPPPPYDPSRPPAIYSPLAPPSPLSPPPPQYPPSTPWPYPQGSSAGSTLNAPYKMGPVAAARARRKRKIQILAMALCAMMVFFVALIMGVLLGVVKVQWKNNDDD